MMRMLLVLVVCVAMFSLSAGASWYLQRLETARTAETGRPEEKGHEGGKGAGAQEHSAKPPTLPVAVDPHAASTSRSAAVTPESIAQVAASQRQQNEALRQREQNLLVRQKHLEIIYQDLRSTRTEIDEFRTKVAEEIKALVEKSESLDHKSTELDKKNKEIVVKADELKKNTLEVDTLSQKNYKKMAITFDSMDAETAGELLQQMADGGKMDMAVMILSTMQEGRAARVLSQMPDRGTAVQLLDRMKNLKRPTLIAP